MTWKRLNYCKSWTRISNLVTLWILCSRANSTMKLPMFLTMSKMHFIWMIISTIKIWIIYRISEYVVSGNEVDYEVHGISCPILNKWHILFLFTNIKLLKQINIAKISTGFQFNLKLGLSTTYKKWKSKSFLEFDSKVEFIDNVDLTFKRFDI